MSKFTSKEQILRWLTSHQVQDSKNVYWSLYKGSEVKSSEMLHTNRIIENADKSNATLMQTIDDVAHLNSELTIFLTNVSKGNTGSKAHVYLLPDTHAPTQSNSISGIHGAANIGELVQKEVQTKVELYELKHKIAELESQKKGKKKDKKKNKSFIQGLVKDFTKHETFNSIQALELGLNIGHRILGFIEKQFQGQPNVGTIGIAGMDREPKEQPIIEKVSQVDDEIEPQTDRIVENQENQEMKKVPDINETIIQLQKQVPELPVEVFLAAMNDFLLKNPMFKPMLKSQLEPYIKPYQCTNAKRSQN
jgi:hypothetical protein